MQRRIPEAWDLPVTVYYSIAATIAEGPGHSYPVMIFEILTSVLGDHSGTVVKVLYYKSEGRWFDSSWCQWIFH